MKDCVRKTIEKVRSKETLEIVGYSCWIIGIVLMLVHLNLYAYLFSVGIATFGIRTGFIGLGIAKQSRRIASQSDDRMQAMANLEFHEKKAVIEAYISDIYKARSKIEEALDAHAKRIYHDVKGAKELKNYVDPQLRTQLDEEINKLKNIANEEPTKYKELIEKLTQLQKEDC